MLKSTSQVPLPTMRTPDQHIAVTTPSVEDQLQSDCSRLGAKGLNPRHRPFSEFTPPHLNIDVYPPALAKHEDVVRDRQLFMDTLNKFHSTLGSKMMIPKIGGTYLDLHLLYQEVTTRGGLQQVIKNRIWKEIKAIFHFPRTATNASFVLRKYYTSLLHHYEQVYFLRAQAPAPISASPAPSAMLRSADNDSRPLVSAGSEPIPKKKRRRHSDPSRALSVNPAASIGQKVTGAIDGKFDHGYLVTVLVGSEKLRGVMYTVPPGHDFSQFATLPLCMNSSNLYSEPRARKYRHLWKRNTNVLEKDPTAPKFNRSGYNFFFAEQRRNLKGLYPDREKEISRMIGDKWSKLTEEEKLPYQQKGQKDKERYKKEIFEYHQRKSMKNVDRCTAFKVVRKQTPQSLDDESEHSDNFFISMNSGTAKNSPMAEPQAILAGDLDGCPLQKEMYAPERRQLHQLETDS